MRLNLNLDGINLTIQITNYKQSKPNNWDDNWCKVSLTLTSNSWLNYSISNQEILMSGELEELIEVLASLLTSNDVLPPFTHEFTEPDLTLNLYPKQDIRNNPSVLYIKTSNEFTDISLDLQIHFWNDGLTANFLQLAFNRKDIQCLATYLKLVANRIANDDVELLLLISQGIISI